MRRRSLRRRPRFDRAVDGSPDPPARLDLPSGDRSPRRFARRGRLRPAGPSEPAARRHDARVDRRRREGARHGSARPELRWRERPDSRWGRKTRRVSVERRARPRTTPPRHRAARAARFRPRRRRLSGAPPGFGRQPDPDSRSNPGAVGAIGLFAPGVHGWAPRPRSP